MKAIILVAGLGSRLRPFTNTVPKALVPLNGHPLIDYQLVTLRSLGITDINLVTGYLPETFSSYRLPCFQNREYANSNMVYSLMCAQDLFTGEDDILICYGDIVYSQDVLSNILNTKGKLVVSADLDWLSLWQFRMDNPYDDAESFIMKEGTQRILSLGKKINSKEDAQAQYIGLLKVSAQFQSIWLDTYRQMPKSYSNNLYMTDFIQQLINEGHEVVASLHQGGWLEVDSVEDKVKYENNDRIKTLLNQINIS